MGKSSVGKVKFYVVKGNKAFWEPSARLRRAGYLGKRLGDAGPRAEAKAAQLTAAALEKISHPGAHTGTLEHFFKLFISTKAMARKKPRTREEYHTAWLRIGPFFEGQLITQIGVDDVDAFYEHLTKNHSPKVRHRAIAKLRAILADAVLRRVIETNPALAIENPAPVARQQFWYADERQALCQSARDLDMPAMALSLRIMDETARAPVDARLLPLNALCRDQSGPFIDRSREKTGVTGMQPLSENLYEALQAYADELGARPIDGTPLLRRDCLYKSRKTREPWRLETDWSKDFRIVREHAFGKEEKRQARDIRRSVNLEAALGDAEAGDRAALLANSLDRDAKLDAVYTPPTLAAARKANAARSEGRKIMDQMQLEKRQIENK